MVLDPEGPLFGLMLGFPRGHPFVGGGQQSKSQKKILEEPRKSLEVPLETTHFRPKEPPSTTKKTKKFSPSLPLRHGWQSEGGFAAFLPATEESPRP